MPKVPKIISLHIFAVSPEIDCMKLRYGIDFLSADKHKYFLQVDSTLWVWVYIAWHVQITENIKFTISLQYFKENLKDEVEFCLLIIVKGFFKVILSLSF